MRAARMEDMDRRAFLLATAAAPVALALDSRALAARLGGSLVLVTADLESHVVVLDPSSARTLARIPTAPGPRSIERVDARTAIVAHTEQGVVSVLDGAAREIRAELDDFGAPRYTAVHPTRPIAYVTDSANEELVAVHAHSGRTLWRTRVPGPARHVSISPDGATVWTALGTTAARIAVLDVSDPRRPKFLRTLAPPFLAHDVVFSPDGRLVWVTSGAERRFALYRTGSRRPARILGGDAPPQHVAFGGGRAFIASGEDGTVRRHRLDGELVRQTHVPKGSFNVAFGSDRLVTPSLGAGTVSMLDRNGRVRAVRRVAQAAHDACIVGV
jgi:DNA-binding beta-propeller fold protein YncE